MAPGNSVVLRGVSSQSGLTFKCQLFRRCSSALQSINCSIARSISTAEFIAFIIGGSTTNAGSKYFASFKDAISFECCGLSVDIYSCCKSGVVFLRRIQMLRSSLGYQPELVGSSTSFGHCFLD